MNRQQVIQVGHVVGFDPAYLAEESALSQLTRLERFAAEAQRLERERVLAAFSSYEIQLRSMGVALQADGLPTREIDAQLETLRVLREAVRRG